MPHRELPAVSRGLSFGRAWLYARLTTGVLIDEILIHLLGVGLPVALFAAHISVPATSPTVRVTPVVE